MKNHAKIVEVAKNVCASDREAHFLLVGDGPLREDVEAAITSAGLRKHFTFTGVRSDVPRLLRAMDTFVFPSKYEGLPIALLEAQFAGLPCVVSDTITPEATLDSGMVTRMPLAAPAAEWANVVRGQLAQLRRRSLSPEIRERVSVAASRRRLEALYDELWLEPSRIAAPQEGRA
jgi:glycosyltransferase involved in cell wall biosynthesis